jgi:hypothetical protein
MRKMVIFSNRYLMKMNLKINSQSLCFHQRDDVAILNKVMQYVQNNESTKKIKIVNVKGRIRVK